MSRVYFHSPSGDAELRGSERALLASVSAGPALAAWGINLHTSLDWMADVIGMIPESTDSPYGSYLHDYLRQAQAEDARNKRQYAEAHADGNRWATGISHESLHRLRSSLELRLTSSVADADFRVAGHTVHIGNVQLNTALAVGSPVIQLAAKIHGWCEIHAWVEGPDRKWLADLIDEGLSIGIYRRGFWYRDTPDGPKDKWSSQGWETVQELLRSRDDEPVVMSYSVSDSFPNSEVAGWEPPPMPDGWAPDWADGDEGRAEWERDYPDPEARAEYYQEQAQDQWYDIPAEEQWRMGMDGLRARRPWAQLSPQTLGDVTFGPGVTVYDLLASDRDERVVARFEGERR